MKGLSTAQRAVIALLVLILMATVAAVLLEQWQLAALGAVLALAVLSGFVIATLAALTRSLNVVRRRALELDRTQRHVLATARRVDHRTAERFKTLESTQDRLEAAERRLLASFEAQRFQIEDDLVRLQEAGVSPRGREG